MTRIGEDRVGGLKPRIRLIRGIREIRGESFPLARLCELSPVPSENQHAGQDDRDEQETDDRQADPGPRIARSPDGKAILAIQREQVDVSIVAAVRNRCARAGDQGDR